MRRRQLSKISESADGAFCGAWAARGAVADTCWVGIFLSRSSAVCERARREVTLSEFFQWNGHVSGSMLPASSFRDADVDLRRFL